MSNRDAPLPDLLPRERFMRVVAHRELVRAIVGDCYAIIVVEVDVLGLDRPCRVPGTDAVDEVLTNRLRKALPGEGLMCRLSGRLFGILAFGIGTEPEALEFAAMLHERLRAPIEAGTGDIHVSASIGVAFTRDDLRPANALAAATAASARVRLNGGDATFVARPGTARHRLHGGRPHPGQGALKA